MTSRYGTRGPRPVASAAGRGPAVHAQHRIRLNAHRGMLSAGFLGEHYRPCPPGAHVLLDCGAADVMTVDAARNIARSLALCSEITVTGTAERGERGYVDDLGLIFGLDAIANTISSLAHKFAMEPRT
ncbi:hypothetical protein [Streptomyces scabiei]|uniref:hypothetical protein n=1 Tax=Streptomyces scabiei TaxID=1930 RepID=UPI001B32E116|nr:MULTISPECIES: hypothetical protein [Streptomyces]MBP5892804.1 hypothetical protein [Streptomyces sp. LBUM 1481]MBP5923070.1 hypothetical protein [Streptomyces sp. LBUM 1483]MDX2686876.1 hypothetical protein [Streptomyces scabiei]MDX2753086.1 hypothetical protein [Streptomyces scabiei]MDX2807275.1 hypothetical protein [Streptomyces scabiei]